MFGPRTLSATPATQASAEHLAQPRAEQIDPPDTVHGS
jgi:hypothetical protein